MNEENRKMSSTNEELNPSPEGTMSSPKALLGLCAKAVATPNKYQSEEAIPRTGTTVDLKIASPPKALQ
jgi:hypothetical protein